MGFAFGTDIILDAIRAKIGPTLAVGGQTLTWAHVFEGQPLRWLDTLNSPSDYPCYVMRPEETQAESGTSHKKLVLPVTVSIAIRHPEAQSTIISPKAYRAARLVGEAVVAKLEDAGHNWGSQYIHSRDLDTCGVDYDLTEELADQGIACYSLIYNVTWYEREVR